MGGTSDTHRYIEKNNPSDFIITVATDYGYNLYYKKYREKVIKIQFTYDSLTAFIKEYSINTIIDTTHPFAVEITNTAELVAKDLNIKYVFAKRNIEENTIKEIIADYQKAIIFDDFRSAAIFLGSKNYKNILFTIGTKNLGFFKEFLCKSFVRILPDLGSIENALKIGALQERIIAMQGPFSEMFNIAVIEEYSIDCIVTKQAGESGGFLNKLKAANKMDINIIIIGNKIKSHSF